MQDLSQVDVKDILKYNNFLAAIVIIGLGIFFLYNAYGSYSNKHRRIKEKEASLQEAKQKIPLLRQAENEYNQLKQGFFENDLAFRRHVEEKARGSGVRIDSLVSSRQEGNLYQVGVIELKVVAPYRNIANFTRGLEEKNVFSRNLSLREEREARVEAVFSLTTVLVGR